MTLGLSLRASNVIASIQCHYERSEAISLCIANWSLSSCLIRFLQSYLLRNDIRIVITSIQCHCERSEAISFYIANWLLSSCLIRFLQSYLLRNDIRIVITSIQFHCEHPMSLRAQRSNLFLYC